MGRDQKREICFKMHLPLGASRGRRKGTEDGKGRGIGRARDGDLDLQSGRGGEAGEKGVCFLPAGSSLCSPVTSAGSARTAPPRLEEGEEPRVGGGLERPAFPSGISMLFALKFVQIWKQAQTSATIF